MFDEIPYKDICSVEEAKFWSLVTCCKCCWVSLTDSGFDSAGLYNRPSCFPDCFRHENLNILFRSASHISSISKNHIERQSLTVPFPAQPVRVPGCFTAHQRELKVKWVEKIDEGTVQFDEEFLEDGFTDRLIVLLAMDVNQHGIDLEKLKEDWNASTVADCNQNAIIDHLSGAEFQSVLIIVDLKEKYCQAVHDINMAVSRAQYEVGIIVAGEQNSYIIKQLQSYLSSSLCYHVEIFSKFLTGSLANEDWLKPEDVNKLPWEWWLRRLRTHLKKQRDATIEIFKRQPVSVRLQLTFAFPSFFTLPYNQSHHQFLNGKNFYVIRTVYCSFHPFHKQNR